MDEEGSLIDQLESIEIKRIKELIYNNKQENNIVITSDLNEYEKIVKRVNQIIDHDI